MTTNDETLSAFLLEEQAEAFRKIAVKAATASVQAVHADGMLRLQDGDAESDDADESLLTYDPAHSGAAPSHVDARARDAAWDVMEGGFEALGIPRRARVAAGEEAGSATREVRRGDYLIRQDSCDGTSNAERLLNEFSSVQLIDQVRSLDPSNPRARHLAGAITNSAGYTVSWTQTSTFVRSRNCYPTVRGRVYIECAPWGLVEREVRGRRWDRRPNTVAAVAASSARMAELQKILSRLGMAPDALYTLGGTPLAPALIAGDIECLIEPKAVTLHDSAHLMPHQILGGMITDLQLNELNYLAVYERSALRLNPGDKPVEGYIAWGDAAAAHRTEAAS